MVAVAESRPFIAVDLFCGAGGMSRGFLRACSLLGVKVKLLAVNHWRRAIATHSRNHPGVEHLCENLDSVNPLDALARLYAGTGVRPTDYVIDLLMAAPECRFFSKARGGKPVREQMRVSPWVILRWLEAVRVKTLLCENVREMLDWGPLDEEGSPIKERKGETFRAFIAALRGLGYTVEFRVLNAARYGTASSRRRLFIIARRGEREIPWPAPTHGPRDAHETLFGELVPERTAREIIEWDNEGINIFDRHLHGLPPLSEKTQRRVLFGTWRYSGKCLVPNFGERKGQPPRAHSLDSPCPTVTSRGAGAFVTASAHKVRVLGDATQPCLVSAGEGDVPYVVEDEPLPVAPEELSRMLASVVEALPLPLDEPVPLDAFLISYHGSHKGKNDGDRRAYSLDAPLLTVDTSNRFAVVRPALVSYTDFKRQGPQRRGILLPQYGVILLFKHRLLSVRELARAQGFDDDYVFEGTQEEQLRQVGNAVPTELAYALCVPLIVSTVNESGPGGLGGVAHLTGHADARLALAA